MGLLLKYTKKADCLVRLILTEVFGLLLQVGKEFSMVMLVCDQVCITSAVLIHLQVQKYIGLLSNFKRIFQ